MIYSHDLERKVLSGLLQHPDKWSEISDYIVESDFYDKDSQVHITLFKMIRNAFNNAESIDDTILIDRIKGNKITFPDSIEPEEYIRSLVFFKISPEVFETAIRDLKKYSLRRVGLDISDKIKKYVSAVDQSENYATIAENLDSIYNTQIKCVESASKKTINIAEEAEELIEHLGENPPDEVGIMSPYPTLNKIYGSLVRPGNCTIVAARAKAGKELANYEKILTPSGWKTHGDIEVGDKVCTPSGRVANIVGVFPQGKKDVYRITFNDGRKIDAGAEHLWNVYGRHTGNGYCNKVVNTLHIKRMLKMKSKTKRTFIQLCEGEYGKDKNLGIDPYCLGALLGDGCFSKGNSTVSIDCGDDEILDRIREKFKCGKTLECKGCKRIRISKYDENFHFFEKYNLLKKGSREKSIPIEYMDSSTRQKLELIRGLFDTDGSVDKTGAANFVTSSKTLANQIKEIIWSLGGVARVAEISKAYDKKVYRKYYNVHIRHNNPEKFFWLTRKREKANRNKTCRLRIESVEKLSNKEEMTCIAIDDPDHLYITTNYIVTHNTTVLVDMATKMSYANKAPIIHFDNGEMSSKELIIRMVAGMSGVPAYLLESGNWRRSSYKDWSKKEVVDRVRSVWDKVKDIKILYENVAGMDVNDMTSLLKRIYYSEIGRGNKAVFSFDYLKTDFNNLGKGSEWAYAGRTLHLFKQCIHRELVFDSEPVIGMLTSVQTNRSGIVNPNASPDTLVEDESIIGGADMYGQFASHLFILRKKVMQELVDEGESFGTHKIKCLLARHLGEEAMKHLEPVKMPDGSLRNNFINLNIENFNVEDRGDLNDIIQYQTGNIKSQQNEDYEEELPEELR